MNLAVYILQGNDPGGFDEMIGQLLRFGLLAVFFLAPLLKRLFGAKEEKPRPRRRVGQPVAMPSTIEPELEDLEDAWTVLPQVEPVASPSKSPVWITDPTPMPTSLPAGDLMHASVVDHLVPLDLPQQERRGVHRGWRSAILMREILAPPVGLRSQNADRAPFG